MHFTEKVNQFDDEYPDLKNVAAICVYPNFAAIVKNTLEVDGVNIACVSGGFPSSQTFIEVKVAETALAITDGADEIDIVISIGKFLSGDYEGMCEEIVELKEVCKEHHLKVILETGALKRASNIKKASILSMYAGADFIKTSTGKQQLAATHHQHVGFLFQFIDPLQRHGLSFGNHGLTSRGLLWSAQDRYAPKRCR